MSIFSQASRPRLFTLLILGMLVCAGPAMAAKGMWRWKDAEGNLNYSDTPPKGVNAEFIASDAVRPSGMQNNTDQQAQSEAANADQSTEAESQADRQMEVMPETDEVLCEQAKRNLETLSNKPRIRVTEADGSKRVLTPEEIEAEKDRARKFIEVYCP